MTTCRCSKRWIAVIVVVGLGAGGAIWLITRGGGKDNGNGEKPPIGAPSETAIEFPDGTSGVNVQATILNDLGGLPKASGGATLVTAGKFEPAGTVFPQGIKVTWPLSEPRGAATELWIVTLDQQRKVWVGNG